MKHCTMCSTDKPFSSFAKNKTMKDGFQAYCKECNKELRKQYKHKNKEYAARFREQNKELCNSRIKEWKKANKGKINSYTAKRHSAKMQRTPIWLTEKDLKVIESKYAIASWLSEIVGREYHVDHILPLQGELVSGLHVPDNLRIIPAKDNMSKNNKWSIE